MWKLHPLLPRAANCSRASAMVSGAAALHALLGALRRRRPRPTAFPNFAPRAKRVIFLFQAGGPSHLDLLDYKPAMKGRFDQDIPAVRSSARQRITGMVAQQDRFPVVPTMYGFQQYGKSGMWLSDLLPHTGKIADEICLLRAMNTEAINHDPAITFIQTGSQLPGRPCMGSWVDYGLGSENENLPAFVVLNSLPSNGMPDQGLLSRLWGAGFLPSRYQGVQFRSAGDPVLHLSNPPGITRERRRSLLDGLAALNKESTQRVGDPEIETRIAQYEMAFRMQASVPDLVDTSSEPEHVHELYGEDSRKPGTFAANCLLARRLAERNVRFIQLYHRGWDHHGGLHAEAAGARARHRPAFGGPDPRPEAARHAGRHAGHLGRRVRPHAVCAGRAQARQLRPRSSWPRLLALDGGRRREARLRPRQLPTTTAST